MKNFRLSIIGGVLFFGLILISCNRSIPNIRRINPTPSPQVLEPMAITRTSLAAQIIATLTAVEQVPQPTAVEQTPEPTAIATTVAPTIPPLLPTTPAPTTQVVASLPVSPTQAVITAAPPKVAPQQPVAQSVSVPSVYYLHGGEFPWCLARRFNINPMQIIFLNRFYYGQVFHTGQPVFLPQNPQPFPGPRALRPHPATHVVRYGQTIFSIACFYGDIDPFVLAELNGLNAPYRLQAGQALTLP